MCRVQLVLPLALQRHSDYLLSMMHRVLMMVFMAIALAGAPFGMGRMMDNAHQSAYSTADAHLDHGAMHHGKAPVHDASKPHFVACAACATVPVEADLLAMDVTINEQVKPMPSAILHGNGLLPDLPPPRA